MAGCFKEPSVPKRPTPSWIPNSLTFLSARPAAGQIVGGQWNTLHQFDGQAAGDELGWSVSGAGDVNGDGFDDLILGAPQTLLGASGPGFAHVYSLAPFLYADALEVSSAAGPTTLTLQLEFPNDAASERYQLGIPNLPPAYIGRTFFAAVATAPTGGSPHYSSIAVPITVVP